MLGGNFKTYSDMAPLVQLSSLNCSSLFIYALIYALFPLAGIVLPLQYCYEGTYEYVTADGYVACDLCPEGTYMPKYDHRETSCYACSKPNPDKYEVVDTPCNRTNDTTFICMKGYYRDLPRNPRETGRCVKCTDCEAQGLYPGRGCQNFSDSICCANEMFDVAVNGDGHPMCRERPRMCGPGQYYSHESYECIPCPSGTYMDLKFHSSTECWKCPSMAEYYVPLHTVIDQECNRTHPSTYRCKDHYYRNCSMGHKDDATGCFPCTKCKFVGRNCTLDTDAVCCPRPNMEVVDTPEGPKCQNSPMADDPGPITEDEASKAGETVEDDQKKFDTDLHSNEGTVVNGTNHVFTKTCICHNDSRAWKAVAITIIVVNIVLVILICVRWIAGKKSRNLREQIALEPITTPPEAETLTQGASEAGSDQ